MALRFGEFDLSPDTYELRRGGRPLHLEPRVFEVLAYLVAHRDRVVTKQELLETFWPKEFVSDSALSRAVRDARRAIGDTGAKDRWVQTVHGRGFRFVGEVTELPLEERSANGRSPLFIVDQPAASAAAPSAVAVAPPSTPSAPPPRAVAGDETAGGSAASHRTRFGSRVGRVLPLALLGLLAVAAALWRARPTPPPTPPVPVRLVLAPFTVSGSNPQLRLVALSVQDLLSRRLGEVQGVELENPGGGLPRAEPAPPAAMRTLAGGRCLVTGSLAPSTVPGRARLAVFLHDFRDAEEPVPVRLSDHDVPFLDDAGDLARFVALREAITAQVVGRLLPVVVSSPGPGSVPRHAEGYRLYLQALQPLRAAACVGPTAIHLLERSLALDPEFAPAWGELGWARYNSVSSCGESGDNYRLALQASERALRLDPHWPRALGLEAVVLVETGEAERAYARLLDSERTARRPGADLPFFKSYVLSYAGFLARSQALVREALRRDPTFLADGGWTPNAWLYRREWDQFLELLPAAESPLFRYYRGWGELRRGRHEAARAILAPAFVGAPNDLFARLSQALLAILEQQPEEARTVLADLVLRRRRTAARDGEVSFKVAQLLALAGERQAATEQARLAIQQGFFCVPCFRDDPVLAPLAAEPALAAELARAEQRRTRFARRFGLVVE
jgi:DNA-binding winged helix-turn-helix (wHTH) protein/tetratricopeptide (TPR) repeat protein